MTELIEFITEEWLLFAALAFLIAIFFYREFSQGGARLSTHELTIAVNNDSAIILDVREKKEFNAGHIIDAINIPHGEIGNSLGKLNKYRDKQIVIVDSMGQHAGTVIQQLTANDFNATRLRGGITEWQQQNLPLVKQ